MRNHDTNGIGCKVALSAFAHEPASVSLHRRVMVHLKPCDSSASSTQPGLKPAAAGKSNFPFYISGTIRLFCLASNGRRWESVTLADVEIGV